MIQVNCPKFEFGGDLLRDMEVDKSCHKTLAELQQEPFLRLYEQLGDVDREVGLVCLATHLTRITRLFGKLEGVPPAALWGGCWSNIHMAASLKGIDVDTDIHGDGDWCGNVSDFESVKSEVVGCFVAGRLAFELVFHAYEVFGQHFCEKSSPVTTQMISRKLMTDDAHRPLVGFRETTLEAIRHLPFKFDDQTQDARRAVLHSSQIGLGAECVRQFRNALVHGRLQAPDPAEWGKDANDNTANSQSILFRWQIRLCLMLIQIMTQRFAGKVVVEDSYFQEFSVEDVVFCLHVKDRYDDDEDNPDEPTLRGLTTAPRFHYW